MKATTRSKKYDFFEDDEWLYNTLQTEWVSLNCYSAQLTYQSFFYDNFPKIKELK